MHSCVSFAIAVCLAILARPVKCKQLSEEDYVAHQELEGALLNSSNNETIPNLYLLGDAFYPLSALQPVCIPIRYRIKCSSQGTCANCINCSDTEYVTNFLWTGYNANTAIGSLLLSYAMDGIELAGFNSWEKVCSFSNPVDLYLNLSILTYSSKDVVVLSLLRITSQLKQFASSQGKPKVGDSSDKGYSIQWNNEDQVEVFDIPNVILTTVFIFLNVFFYFLSISLTAYSYDNLFRNVKHKKNPGYPIFWGLVVFTFCWNIAPSWLVFVRYSTRVLYSLAVMIPLQFFVALFVKKKSNFPIPGMSPNGCLIHRAGYHFFWERNVLTCRRCLFRHIVQIISIWSILVSFLFLIYYLSAVIVTFYLYPTSTLIKVVFVKGIAVTVILIFSLLFSLGKFKFKCTAKAAKTNCVAIMSLFTVITFMPVLAYLAFVIGGIIFAETTSDTNTLRSILTLLPSAFLLFIAWASRGHLFPNGLHSTDPVKEIASDLEEGHQHKDKDKDEGHVQVPLAQTPSTYGTNQGSAGEQGGDRKSAAGEHTALLPN